MPPVVPVVTEMGKKVYTVALPQSHHQSDKRAFCCEDNIFCCEDKYISL